MKLVVLTQMPSTKLSRPLIERSPTADDLYGFDILNPLGRQYQSPGDFAIAQSKHGSIGVPLRESRDRERCKLAGAGQARDLF